MSTNEKTNIQLKIERYRNRQAAARFEAMADKTGSNCVLVNLPDGTMATVEVSQESLIDALKYFESIVYGEYSRAESVELILRLYISNLSMHGDKLTEAGNAFMNDLIKQTVMMAKEQGIDGEQTVH
ncbi:hypothetical protein [Rahnella sp. ChDrAdgB13]|uniref:hypothetical protein n=1 Tax=Rahnella sp. ChDrAdgB13 TaxID=1850581 RepID=UPI001AD854C3|nr:hypothetical protein [Rahnella sp. ChDrAdgB13]